MILNSVLDALMILNAVLDALVILNAVLEAFCGKFHGVFFGGFLRADAVSFLVSSTFLKGIYTF